MAKPAHPQTIAAIRRLRRDGWSYYRLGKLCGYSRVCVRTWCDEEAKDKIRAHAKRMSKEEKARRWQAWEGRKRRSDYYADRKAVNRERVELNTPPWLTADHKAQIKAVYAEARELTRLTGIRHEVDHIHPINGTTVCGLHVPWNLQVLSKEENGRKSNNLTVE